jgi:ABC-type transporter Mla subunit MlaD
VASYRAVMADQSQGTGIGDLLNTISSHNPLSGITRSIGQAQHGVDSLLTTIDNLNDTLVEINTMARRVNDLLDTFEGPIRAAVPQMQRTIETAEMLVQTMSGPINRVAPGLSQLADTLQSPSLTSLSDDVGEFLKNLRGLSARLQPLTQLAETAGSFGLRNIGSLLQTAQRVAPGSRGRPATTADEIAEPDVEALSGAGPAIVVTEPAAPATHPVDESADEERPSPPVAAKKIRAKSPAGKAPAKKAPARTKAPARKKAPAKKAAARKAPATKAPAKKAPATKAPAKKASAGGAVNEVRSASPPAPKTADDDLF